MSLTKEIMVEAFRFDASNGPFYLKHCNKQNRISLSPTSYCSSVQRTNKQQMEKKVVQQLSHHHSQLLLRILISPGRGLAAWKPASETMNTTVKVTATVTIKNSKRIENEIMSMMLQKLEAFNKTMYERGMVMQLVRTEVDPRTMEPKVSKNVVLEWMKEVKVGTPRATYKVEFEIDSDFGVRVAITVVNKYEKEFFLEDIVIEGIFRFS